MATVKIEQFCGIAPRTHPTLLADGMAVTAHNCRLKNGKLVPLKQPLLVRDVSLLMESSYLDGSLVSLTDAANAKSIHAWKETDGSIELMLFPGVTWMSEGNIADDELTRVVVSGDTGADFEDSDGNVTHNAPVIYMRDETSRSKIVHPLCKNPLPAPKVKRVSTTTLDDNKRYTYFFITWVDEYGYESPVSEQSMPFRERLTVADGWTITVSGSTVTARKDGETTRTSDTDHTIIEYSSGTITAASFYKKSTDDDYGSGDIEYMDGDTIQIAALGSGNVPSDAVKIRVYKVVTGTEEGRIQFVKETSATGMDANPLNVTVKDEDTGEVLTEIEAPFSDMRCILDVPGAYYCGFAPSHPKTVCFSEVDLLYSWPVAYQYDVKDNIVALAVTSNTVFALTDGWPYVLTGTDPSGMTVTKLAGPASCVSARGVCVFKNAVYYVGQQGLMTIYNDADEGTVCKNLTDKIFTKGQWQAFNPSSCVMGQFDGALLLFFTSSDGKTHTGLTIDLTESACAVTTHDEVAKCVCTDNRTDKMYYVREGV